MSLLCVCVTEWVDVKSCMVAGCHLATSAGLLGLHRCTLADFDG